MTNPSPRLDLDEPHGTQQISDGRPGAPGRASGDCPGWCVAEHAVHQGEEDWVHTGQPLDIADGVSALLCMSVHPTTGEEDGPYVLIGTTELTLVEAVQLGTALLDLADAS